MDQSNRSARLDLNEEDPFAGGSKAAQVMPSRSIRNGAKCRGSTQPSELTIGVGQMARRTNQTQGDCHVV